MKVSELIERLSKLPSDAEIMILDGFNGAMRPRTINLPPNERRITKSDIKECYDCKEFDPGFKVFVMGYGFY